VNQTQRSWPASHRGTGNPLYDGDNEESTGSNHQLNPTAPANRQLSNEAVSRQLAEIARMLAQLTSQVAIGKTLAAPAAQGTNSPSTTPAHRTQIQPKIADARLVDPLTYPAQNQPEVPELWITTRKRSEESLLQYRPCPWFPLQ